MSSLSCFYCDSIMSSFTCRGCHRIVCHNHYFEFFRTCLLCRSRELEEKSEEESEEESEFTIDSTPETEESEIEESEIEPEEIEPEEIEPEEIKNKEKTENIVFRYEGLTDEEKDETIPSIDEDKCPICLETIGETMYIRCIKHSIHIKCMNSCKKMDCPICRRNFFDKSFTAQMYNKKV